MKKVLSLLLAAALLFSLTVTPAFAAAPSYKGKVAPSYKGKTVILYTGNVRGDLDVYPKIKTAKDAYEAAGAEVILVDAGNWLQGSDAANTTRGAAVYELMEAAGYDIAAMGLAEFGYTDATTGLPYHGNVTRYYTQAMLQNGTMEVTYNVNRDGSVTATLPARKAASFQTLAANVTTEKDCYSFEPYTLVETQSGLTLAFYGITDPAVEDNVQDGFVSVADPEKSEGIGIAHTMWELNADILICLSNAGFSGTGSGYGDIAVSVPTGTEMEVGAWVIDSNGGMTREEVDLGRCTPDADMAALVSRIKAEAGEALFTSEVILNGADSANRNVETNQGDLVTDALVWYAKNYIDGLDPALPLVAIQNGGNIDQFLYTGEVTATDLLRALPFSPMGVGVICLTGEQLLETLEAAAQKENCAGFAQVSGMTYTLNLSEDYDAGAAYGSFFEADSVNRVTITSINGQPFDPEATYAVVGDNYILNGSDTYYTMTAAREAGAAYLNNGNGMLTRDIVARYVQNVLDGVISAEYAQPQGRITVLKAVFPDVSPNDDCYEAVLWALENGITTGADDGLFHPDDPCTRAQAVTFLCRAQIDQDPAWADAPFTDVNEDAYYYRAILWAGDTGFALSTDHTTFGPDLPVSRAEAISFLWQFLGGPVVNYLLTFSDVDREAWYTEAVRWAASEGIITAADGDLFNPDAPCDRAEMLTFLYRLYANN